MWSHHKETNMHSCANPFSSQLVIYRRFVTPLDFWYWRKRYPPTSVWNDLGSHKPVCGGKRRAESTPFALVVMVRVMVRVRVRVIYHRDRVIIGVNGRCRLCSSKVAVLQFGWLLNGGQFEVFLFNDPLRRRAVCLAEVYRVQTWTQSSAPAEKSLEAESGLRAKCRTRSVWPGRTIKVCFMILHWVWDILPQLHLYLFSLFDHGDES